MALKKRLIAALIGAVVVIFVTGVCILPIPGIYDPYPFPTQTTMHVTILIIENDVEHLPNYLSEPLLQEYPAISLQEAVEIHADAILISRELLFAASEDPAIKDDLRGILKNRKILLVYDASTVDIAQQLDLGTPKMITQTTYHAVGSVAMTNDVVAAGGVLLSKNHTEERLVQDIREYIPFFRAAITGIQATADAARAMSTLTPQPFP